MDDEFALCWNNFQDNIASGFQNLYDRGDLVDVTLACDGKLLHAHKIVLAICSPYFQEIFISNPCKHPIIILKDVTVGVMCELLQFMYQGVVNVKHTELQAFMKIAQLLQIKGLASNTSAPQKSPSQIQSVSSANTNHNTGTSSASGSGTNSNHKHSSNNESNNINDTKTNIPAPSSSSSTSSPSPMQFSHIKSPPENTNPFQTGPGLKRLPEYSTDSLSIYSRNKFRRNTDNSDHDMGPDSLDNVNQEDSFLSTIPHISMVESRFDINSVKRENNDHTSSSASLRNTMPPHFGFDYNLYKNNPEYPNDLHIPNDYSKSFSNHMDIPPSGGNVTMLSSTSLLHANCVFNRNNTVATQQGMKTYWLCKSYRISMCRARCITHQGRVISATGVHNHPPHMRNVGGGLEMIPPQQNNPGLMVPNSGGNIMQIPTSNTNLNSTLSNIRLPQGAANLSQHNLAVMNHQQQQSTQPPAPHHHHLQQGLSSSSSHHQIHQNLPSHHHHPSQHVSSHTQSSVIQNMMHNVNLMHLSNMAPILNTLPTQHSPQINTLHSQQQQSHHHQTHHQIPQPPSSLEITPILTESPCVNSPSNRSSNPSQGGENLDSPMHSSAGPNPSSGVAMESPSQGSEGNGSSHVPDGTPSLVPNPSGSPDDMSNNCQDSHNTSQHSHIISSITISPVAPGERWFHGKLEFMLSQRGKPLLVHDGHTFGIQYVRKDKKYWQCNLSRKFNCKARVTTTETGEIIVTNNEHCHTEIRQHLRKDYQRNKVMMNALINLSTNHLSELRRQQSCNTSNNNFGNINSLSSSSSNRLEKDYRSFSEVGLESSIATNVVDGKVSPPPNTEKVIAKQSDITNDEGLKNEV